MLLREGCMVWLYAEMLIDFGLTVREEPPNLFNSRVLDEQVGQLQLCTMVGVIAHQELCQKYAGVEPCTDRLIDLSFLRVDKAVNLP